MSASSTSVTGALILVVDDDPAVLRALTAGLTSHGYRTLEATTAAEALSTAGQYAPDAILLDLGLPDMDGLAVTRTLRKWYAAPILVVSARHEEKEKVRALDAGADDYVVKPFGLEELTARLRAALRRTARPDAMATGGVFKAGRLSVDLAARRVFMDEAEVRLTRVEYKILLVLVKSAGCVVTHDQLMREVWGPGADGENRALRVYMTHLRRKLEPDRSRPTLFTTEAGVGYRLNVD